MKMRRNTQKCVKNLTINVGFGILLIVIVLHMLAGRVAEKGNFREEVPFFIRRESTER